MDKIRVLFLAANPADTSPLKLDEELRSITEKIRASEYRDSLRLESVWAVRPDDLLQSLNLHKPHIVHFSGHGSTSGKICLLDSKGETKPVSPIALESLFHTLKDNVRVIVLNACYSQEQAMALAKIIDCVIGMKGAIEDQAAIIFAASFYRAIGFGRSIQESFEQGITALMLEGIADSNKPMLHVRGDINPSKLFLLSDSTYPIQLEQGGLSHVPSSSFENTLEKVNPDDIKFNVAVWHDTDYVHLQRNVRAKRDFFDRAAEKHIVNQSLMEEGNQPVIIIGERRVGKTSFLKTIVNHFLNNPNARLIPVEIPWQGIYTREEFVREVLSAISIATRQPDLITASSEVSQITTSDFIASIRKLLTKSSSKVLLSIDEFDSIIYVAEDTERNRIANLPLALIESDLPIKLLLSTTHVPMSLSQTYFTPLIAKSAIIHLHPFNRNDMDFMLEELVGELFSSEHMQLLYELSGGWPYFAKAILVWLSKGSPGDSWIYDALSHAIADPRVEYSLSNIYEIHFDDKEKAVVLLLAKKDGYIGSEDLIRINSEVMEGFRSLVQRDYVTGNSTSGYRFRIGFLTHWFRKWHQFDSELYRLGDLLT